MKKLAVDIVSRTANPYRYIPVINQNSPVTNYEVNEQEARYLIQIADLWITVSGTNVVLSGDNFDDYFPSGGGGGGGGGDGHTHSNLSILEQITAAFTIEDKQKLVELMQYQSGEGISIDDSTGVISNSGVLNITQEDPEHPNVLTIKVNNTTKKITIPVNEAEIYPMIDDDGLYTLLHEEPDDWSTNWMDYYMKTFYAVTEKPAVFYPTQLFKYEDGQYVLGSADDEWEDCTWYKQHYLSLNPNIFTEFLPDVYYKSQPTLIVDGEPMSKMIAKINLAIESIERLEANKVAVKEPTTGSEVLELF